MFYDLVFNVLPRYRAVLLLPLLPLTFWFVQWVSEWWWMEKAEKERRTRWRQ